MSFLTFYEEFKSFVRTVGPPFMIAYAIGSVIIIVITIIAQYAYKKLTKEQTNVCRTIYVRESITIIGLFIYWLSYKKELEKDDSSATFVMVIIVILWILRLAMNLMNFSSFYNKLPRTPTLTALKIFCGIFYIIDVITMSLLITLFVGCAGYIMMIILGMTLNFKETPSYVSGLLNMT